MNGIRRCVIGVVGLALICLAPAEAQEAPTPGPEHARLGFWVGEWVNEGEVKANPMMPAGKMTSHDRCEWFATKFAVVCHTEGKGPMGPMKGLGIMSYSADAEAYTYYGLDNSGMTMTTVPLGQIDGKTWIYHDETTMGGQKMKSRFTMVQTSDASYTFKWEMQGPEGRWMTIMEGTGKKV